MADELSFRPPMLERRPPADPSPLIALLLLMLGALAVTRPWWGGRVPDGVLVEVRGEVPRPGHHIVDPPTVEAALAAAGVSEPPADARVVPEGQQVRWEAGTATIRAPSDPLLVGLPIDIDRADAHALEAIPGIGAVTAARIVADREANGPFGTVEALGRVSGVGPATVERMRPFVTAGP